MSVDLKMAGAFTRGSVLVEPSYLVVLEHQITSDRMRRILFDRVESVTLWRRLAWGRLILLLIAFGLAGGLLLVDVTAVRSMGGALMFVFALLMLHYLRCGVTRIRIVRDGEERTFSTIASPRRIRQFLDKLDTAIRATQARAWTELQEMAPEGGAASPGPDADPASGDPIATS